MRSESVWQAMEEFFGTRWRIAIDYRCLSSRDRSLRREKDLTDAKWSLDASLPMMLENSEWAGSPANATLVAFYGRRHSRTELSECVRSVTASSPRSATLWFMSSTDRGRCCDGGQLRDPRLLRHHFIVLSGERGRFLFREKTAKHKWRAPVSRNTAPLVRCFDDAKDLVLPPPAFTRHAGSTVEEAANASARDLLAMHAEGGQSPPEYDLRRAVTRQWAPDWWQGASQQKTLDSLEEEGVRLFIRKRMTRSEHEASMARSKFCLVIEGHSPWTPRLVEAIKAGCVPAILSPSYRLPYSKVLDWTKFAVFLRPSDIPNIPSVLLRYDYEKLSENLMKVRKLFSYCVPPHECSGDDAVPLVAFQIATKNKIRTFGEKNAVISALSVDETSKVARRVRIEFECDDSSSSCAYSFDGQLWNCSAVDDAACSCHKKNPTSHIQFSH